MRKNIIMIRLFLIHLLFGSVSLVGQPISSIALNSENVSPLTHASIGIVGENPISESFENEQFCVEIDRDDLNDSLLSLAIDRAYLPEITGYFINNDGNLFSQKEIDLVKNMIAKKYWALEHILQEVTPKNDKIKIGIIVIKLVIKQIIIKPVLRFGNQCLLVYVIPY